MPQVISGFPGVGKSHLRTLTYGVVDCDSSQFSWLPATPGRERARNPAWPLNYIQHIRGLLNQSNATYILVSSHQAVRSAMKDEGIPYLLVYPSADLQREYIQRYITRGNNPDFVALLETHYQTWIAELAGQQGCEHRVLQTGQYLADVLNPLEPPYQRD